MYTGPYYKRLYTKEPMKLFNNWSQWHDHRGQLIIITLSPSMGSQVHFFTKFPSLSGDFRRVPDEASGFYSPFLHNNLEGLLNGLYFVSDKTQNRRIPINTFDTSHHDNTQLDIWHRAVQCDRYHLINHLYSFFTANIEKVNPKGQFQLKLPNSMENFSESAQLKEYGMCNFSIM